MNTEATFANALIGAIGYLVLQLLAPIGVGLGNLTLSLWLVPLLAIHLWPRYASTGWSVLLILAVAFAADLAGGLRLGTSALLALLLFGAIRPDLRPDDIGELRMWLTFSVAILALVSLVALATGEWRSPLGLLIDALVAIALFPLVFRLLRLLRGRGGDSREVFP